MSTPVIKVENLSKKYCRSLKQSLWYGLKDITGEILLSSGKKDKLRKSEFWALNDVSFELHRGETLGLIGHNGSGKSTTLKVINGLIKPDIGRVTIRGRIGALIELGAGFNPILTGRENIYVNAAVLGLSRKEVDNRLEEIIDFAEIGEFIDAPLQSYSSGMKVRLGFSVASHLNPDILLVDEVLSVGDASFRQRCLDHMNNYKKNGGTIIFISHNSVAVEAISDKVMLLNHGKVIEYGNPRETIERYERDAMQLSMQAELRIKGKTSNLNNKYIELLNVGTTDMNGSIKSEFDYGEPISVQLQYQLQQNLKYPYFRVGIKKGDVDHPFITCPSMHWDDIRLESIPEQGEVICELNEPSLSPGYYRIFVGVQSQQSSELGEKWYYPYEELGGFTILPGELRTSLPGAAALTMVYDMPPLVMKHAWRVNGKIVSNNNAF